MRLGWNCLLHAVLENRNNLFTWQEHTGFYLLVCVGVESERRFAGAGTTLRQPLFPSCPGSAVPTADPASSSLPSPFPGCARCSPWLPNRYGLTSSVEVMQPECGLTFSSMLSWPSAFLAAIQRASLNRNQTQQRKLLCCATNLMLLSHICKRGQENAMFCLGT